MNGATPQFSPIFFELFESLPRQGPGNRACAARALALCRDLPPAPAVLDLGCGAGGQTIHLAELTSSGAIAAIDSHAPNIERLRARAAELGLSQRISAEIGDMADLNLPPASFDLIWSEGALYNIGIENALRICRGLLRPGGYLAFTDAIWRKDNPPPEVKAMFELDYPAMGWIPDVLAAIDKSDFTMIGHFTLPEEAWWDDFYTPMEIRVEELRGKYKDDDEALAVLEQLAQEPAMHRMHSDYYAYEFFVARRKGRTNRHRLPSAAAHDSSSPPASRNERKTTDARHHPYPSAANQERRGANHGDTGSTGGTRPMPQYPPANRRTTTRCSRAPGYEFNKWFPTFPA